MPITFLQAISHFVCGSIQTVDTILAVVVRLLVTLGAFSAPLEDPKDLESGVLDKRWHAAHHHRNIFWICYTFDKDLAFRTGRLPIINDSQCDLTLPQWYLRQSRAPQNSWRLPSDLRISQIKSQAYDQLYSPRAQCNSDAAFLKDIRELDDQLETWRQSLPIEARPPLAYSQEPPSNHKIHVRYFLLRLEYHHCMTTIHQASTRCQVWNDNQLIQQGVSSSLDLALESSRSLLLYFRSADRHLVPHLFWLVVFYPLHAALTLFCNILLNPTSDVAKADLCLLEDEIEDIQKHHRALSRRFSPSQLAPMRHVYEYTEQLVKWARQTR